MTRIVYSLPIKASLILRLYLISIHLIILFVIITLPVSFTSRLMIFSIVLASFHYYFLHYNTSDSPYFVCLLERNELGQWSLHYGDQSIESALVLTQSIVTTFGVALYFKKDKGRGRSVFICQDAVDDALFRQLRIYCRDPKTFQQ